MNEDIPLKPWLDDSDVLPEVRDLLRVGQLDGPTDADLARLASRLAPAVGLSVLTAPTRALAETVAPANPVGFVPVKAAMHGFALKALLPGMIKVVAVVGTVGLTAMLWPKAPQERAAIVTSGAQIAHPAREVAASEVASPVEVVPPVLDVLPVEALPSEAPPTVALPAPPKAKEKVERRAKASPPEAAHERSQESELTLIRRAQELRAHPAEALAVLATHERSYPDGMLVQEREVLAIEALLQAGRRADAEKRATRMEQRFVGSAHLRRVRVLLETATAE